MSTVAFRPVVQEFQKLVKEQPQIKPSYIVPKVAPQTLTTLTKLDTQDTRVKEQSQTQLKEKQQEVLTQPKLEQLHDSTNTTIEKQVSQLTPKQQEGVVNQTKGTNVEQLITEQSRVIGDSQSEIRVVSEKTSEKEQVKEKPKTEKELCTDLLSSLKPIKENDTRDLVFNPKKAPIYEQHAKKAFTSESFEFLQAVKTLAEKNPPSVQDIQKLFNDFIKEGSEKQVNLSHNLVEPLTIALAKKPPDLKELLPALNNASSAIVIMIENDIARFKHSSAYKQIETVDNKIIQSLNNLPESVPQKMNAFINGIEAIKVIAPDESDKMKKILNTIPDAVNLVAQRPPDVSKIKLALKEFEALKSELTKLGENIKSPMFLSLRDAMTKELGEQIKALQIATDPVKRVKKEFQAITLTIAKPSFFEKCSEKLSQTFKGTSYQSRESQIMRTKAKEFCNKNAQFASELLMRGTTSEIEKVLGDVIIKQNPSLAGEANKTKLKDMIGGMIVGLIENSGVTGKINKDNVLRMQGILTQLPSVHKNTAEEIVKNQIGVQNWNSYVSPSDTMSNFSRTKEVLSRAAQIEDPVEGKKAYEKAFREDCEEAFAKGKLNSKNLFEAYKLILTDHSIELMDNMGINLMGDGYDFTAPLMETKNKDLKNMVSVMKQLNTFEKQETMFGSIKDFGIQAGVNLKSFKNVGELENYLKANLDPRKEDASVIKSRTDLLAKLENQLGRQQVDTFYNMLNDSDSRYSSAIDSLKDAGKIDKKSDRFEAMTYIWNKVIGATGKEYGSGNIDENAAFAFLEKVLTSNASSTIKKEFVQNFESLAGFNLPSLPMKTNVQTNDPLAMSNAKLFYSQELKNLFTDSSVKNQEGTTGVCEVFYKDINRASYSISDGSGKKNITAENTPKSKSESIAQLKEYCGNDPKLLLLVSQLACQPQMISLGIAYELNGCVNVDGQKAFIATGENAKVNYDISKKENGDIVIKGTFHGTVNVVQSEDGSMLHTDINDSFIERSSTIVIHKNDYTFELSDMNLTCNLKGLTREPNSR